MFRGNIVAICTNHQNLVTGNKSEELPAYLHRCTFVLTLCAVLEMLRDAKTHPSVSMTSSRQTVERIKESLILTCCVQAMELW